MGITRTRNIEYPKIRVVLFWDKHRVAFFKTRISQNPNFSGNPNTQAYSDMDDVVTLSYVLSVDDMHQFV
jgi:hypothetical protein